MHGVWQRVREHMRAAYGVSCLVTRLDDSSTTQSTLEPLAGVGAWWGPGVQTGFGGNVVTYRKLFHLLIGNCFITSGLLIEITVRRVPKFTISVLGGDLVILMILTMRRTTWTTLQGLRATGFPITRGRSLAPTPASGSSGW